MLNLIFENEFHSNENELLGGTRFDMNGLTQRLILIQRHKVSQKWPIDSSQALRNVLCLMIIYHVYTLLVVG